MAVHRFAFSLSGGLALGAYEAGVLAQLYADLHAVNSAGLGCQLLIDAVSGASAGSITGLVLIQAIAAQWAPADFTDRMWQAWVAGPDVSALLQPADGPEEGVFTQDRLDRIARASIDDLPPAPTDDLPQVVAVWMAVTNPEGIPIRIVFPREDGSETTLYTYSYRDYTPYFVCGPNIRNVTIRTEELAGPPPADPRTWWDRCSAATWRDAAANAVASGSFPGAFRTKPLERDLTLYGDYSEFKQPDWPDRLTYQVTDGGILGNEPIGKAIDAVAFLERLDPARAGDARTYLMIEPSPDTLESLGKALRAVQDQNAPNGLNPFAALLQIVSVYFNTALYSDFLNAEQVNAQLKAIDALNLDAKTKADVLRAVGLDYKKPVVLERIPHAIPTKDRLAGDFFGDFGGFLQQDFRAFDFSVGQRESRAWLAGWLLQNASTLGVAGDAAVAALGPEPPAYTAGGQEVDLSDAGWCRHMTEARRNDIVNQALDRLEQLLFRALNANVVERKTVDVLRHVLGAKIHAALVACPPKG